MRSGSLRTDTTGTRPSAACTDASVVDPGAGVSCFAGVTVSSGAAAGPGLSPVAAGASAAVPSCSSSRFGADGRRAGVVSSTTGRAADAEGPGATGGGICAASSAVCGTPSSSASAPRRRRPTRTAAGRLPADGFVAASASAVASAAPASLLAASPSAALGGHSITRRNRCMTRTLKRSSTVLWCSRACCRIHATMSPGVESGGMAPACPGDTPSAAAEVPGDAPVAAPLTPSASLSAAASRPRRRALSPPVAPRRDDTGAASIASR
mmetsp:Transcript_28723/g.89006  ORF Transcript_28723/g.89006 Transcript_28723/m.89006 type:complete len:267 (+) Transcript_28723:38-838(+)